MAKICADMYASLAGAHKPRRGFKPTGLWPAALPQGSGCFMGLPVAVTMHGGSANRMAMPSR